ncbi:MAG: ROK family protein [Boseongicola sp.]
MIALQDIVVGANAERSRGHNRRMVLGRMRKAGQIGRADAARASGLSTQAVSNIIAELLEEGLIVEKGRRTVGRGLPALQYSLNPSGGYAVGFEIRPDAAFVALLDLSGKSVASGRRPLDAMNEANVRQAVLEMHDEMLSASDVSEDRLMGAGVVMPGPFGATGISGSGLVVQFWGGEPPGNWFSELLNIPVLVENDANAAAIAERISGVARGLDSYAFLYFGNGLGLGAVHNGHLVTGAFGNAGEIGHIPVPSNGETVILESAVSRLSVQRALGEVGVQVSSVEQLELLYCERHPVLMDWLDAAVAPLSAAITIVENFIDPQAVIVGGAMPDCILDYFVDAAQLSDISVANRTDRAQPRLLRGASGRMTATLGAAALVINQAFTPKIAVQA